MANDTTDRTAPFRRLVSVFAVFSHAESVLRHCPNVVRHLLQILSVHVVLNFPQSSAIHPNPKCKKPKKAYICAMKVCLIASNPNANVPTEGYDLYVHFNSATHFHKTPKDKSIIAVRKAKEIEAARSFRAYPNTTDPTTPIIAIGWRNEVNAFFMKYPQSKTEMMPIDGTPYPEGNSPTSGWVAIWYYLLRGYDVTVCGFDLKVAPYYTTTRLHLPDYEIEGLKKLIERKEIQAV